jgi:predicted DNA binding CopG/RHH family protein
MTKASKSTKTKLPPMPKFKSYEEEAKWFDDNREALMEFVSKYGKVVPPRRVIRTQQLTMRIPVTDIEQARKIGEKEGIGYQTVLKRAIREGLKRAG